MFVFCGLALIFKIGVTTLEMLEDVLRHKVQITNKVNETLVRKLTIKMVGLQLAFDYCCMIFGGV